jgi:repressor LexA
MRELTDRQIEVMEFIQEFIRENTYPPTIREIASSFNFSVKAAYDHVKAIEKKGIIKTGNNKSRSLEIMDETYSPAVEIRHIPLLGTVAAGLPLMAEENMEGTMPFAESLLGTGEYFALHIQGDSMIDAGICNGDIAVIRHTSQVENGDIIVARIDEESVTIKRYFKEQNRIRLQPENPAFAPIYTRDMRILGKLHMIMRSYE